MGRPQGYRMSQEAKDRIGAANKRAMKAQHARRRAIESILDLAATMPADASDQQKVALGGLVLEVQNILASNRDGDAPLPVLRARARARSFRRGEARDG
jgi:hypothetical protein